MVVPLLPKELIHGLLPATPAFPWRLAPLDVGKLDGYLSRCEWLSIGYGLGSKAHNLMAIPPDYSEIDCSGWVRAAVAIATGGVTILPDGSVIQHEWCDQVGLKKSAWPALLLRDGCTRLCFIVPSPAHPVGHVLLVRNGQTYESWGGHGPGSRSILSHISLGVLQRAIGAVYILGRVTA